MDRAVDLSTPQVLTAAEFARAADELAARDPALAQVIAHYGLPTPWLRPPGFATLIHIMLEQQVSIASARASLRRLELLAAPLLPERVLALEPEQLRSAGLSRQKAGYCHNIARAVVSGQLDLEQLQALPDDQARERLMAVKGIGRWTADVYLLMALRRADIWPIADIGLIVGTQRLRGLSARPTGEEMELIGEGWRPWRSVAAWLIWHYYLSRQANR